MGWKEGLYVGGQFWNGRASDLAKQAKKPFLKQLNAITPDAVTEIYHRMAKTTSAFEQVPVFKKYTSKFDDFLAGMTTLAPVENEGFELY